MLMCLDVGNTHILGGVFTENKLIARFCYATHLVGTADQLGLFLLNILSVNGIQPSDVTAVAVASVVPSCDYTLRHTIKLYFPATYYTLQAGVKTGLNIKYKNPNEVGADRIANAIGAVAAFPNKNIIIVDMGTATTICAVDKNSDYLGGAILPGIRLGMESLKINTAKLMEVDIEIPETYLGRTTRESIQKGLYYSHLGALKEIIHGFTQELFPGQAVTVIATGGFAQLFKDKQVFDILMPDLVLQGLQKAFTYSVERKANHVTD